MVREGGVMLRGRGDGEGGVMLRGRGDGEGGRGDVEGEG